MEKIWHWRHEAVRLWDTSTRLCATRMWHVILLLYFCFIPHLNYLLIFIHCMIKQIGLRTICNDICHIIESKRNSAESWKRRHIKNQGTGGLWNFGWPRILLGPVRLYVKFLTGEKHIRLQLNFLFAGDICSWIRMVMF